MRLQHLTTFVFVTGVILAAGCGTSSDECSSHSDCTETELCTVDGRCASTDGEDGKDVDAGGDADTDAGGGDADTDAGGGDADTDAGGGDADTDADDLSPELTTSPEKIIFPSIDPGATVGSFLTVENTGGTPLEIIDVWITGSDRFEVSFPAAHSTPRDEDSDTWPSRLDPGDTFLVRVTFSPENDQSEEGELNIRSSDPNSPTTTIPLTIHG